MSETTIGYVISEAQSEPSKPEIVSSDHKSLIIKANLQGANEVNRNNRRYGKSVLEKAINTPYIQERLESKTLYGEAGGYAL